MGSPGGTAAAEEHGIRRSPHWPTVEKHFLAANPRCIACNDEQHAARIAQNPLLPTRGLQVHHAAMPFHFCILLGRPDLELDPRNLVVLCEDEKGVKTCDHHISVGHALDFQSYMPDAAAAAKRFFGLTKAQLILDPNFVASVSIRPKAWRDLTQPTKDWMRHFLDQTFPR